MAKRYYNLEKETKALLKRWEETRGVLPDSAGIKRVNEYILRKKGLGEILGGIGKRAGGFTASSKSMLYAASEIPMRATAPFTICLWANLINTATSSIFVDKSNESSTREYRLDVNAVNTITWRVFNTGTWPGISVAQSGFIYGVWNFVCVGWDGSNIFMQINNGTATSVACNAVYNFTNPFRIGGYGTIWGASGRIQCVGFWLKNLSLSQRTFLYNSGSGRGGLECLAYDDVNSGMVSFWPINSTTTNKINIVGQNSLILTDTGSTGRPSVTLETGIVEDLF